MSLMIALSLAIFAWLSISFALWVMDRHNHDLAVSADYVDRFYDRSKRLLNNPDVPEVVQGFIVKLAHEVGKPKLARMLARLILFDRRELAAGRPKVLNLQSLQPEIQHMVIETVVSALVSSAASDLLFSRWYLSQVEKFLSEDGSRSGAKSPDRVEHAAIVMSASNFAHA